MFLALGNNKAACRWEHVEIFVLPILSRSSTFICCDICRLLGLWIQYINLFAQQCQWSSLDEDCSQYCCFPPICHCFACIYLHLWLSLSKSIHLFPLLIQFLHILQIFASPTYEYLDTRFGIRGSALAAGNLSFRIAVRGGYLTINTFIAALLPFLGDFMSLTGAISTFPLTFILANHMYLVAKKTKLSSLGKLWRWFNVCFFGCLAVTAAIAALRLIAVDSKTYHVFADL